MKQIPDAGQPAGFGIVCPEKGPLMTNPRTGGDGGALDDGGRSGRKCLEYPDRKLEQEREPVETLSGECRTFAEKRIRR